MQIGGVSPTSPSDLT